MRAALAQALTLAVAALPATARDLDCRAETVCRSAACAAAEGAGFVLAGADGPAPAVLREGERVAVRARVGAGAALVRFEGLNRAGRVEQVTLYPGTGAFAWTRDAARRNAPVWSGTCRPAAAGAAP